jgi:uncharacterized lipoprotein YbaY
MNRSLLILILAFATSFALGQNFDVLYSQKANRWEAKVSYPKFMTMDMVSSTANRGAYETAKHAYDEFLANARRVEKLGWEGRAWSLEANAAIGVATASINSIMWTGYEYTGGANGQSFFISKTYGPKGDDWGELHLPNFLLPGTDKVTFVREAVLPKLNGIKKQRNLEPFYDITPEMAEQFVITPAGMTWLFNKYDVGSGAEGTYQIKVKWSEMPAGLDHNGLLSGLIASAENPFPVSGTLNWTGDATMPPGAVAEFRLFTQIADRPLEPLQTRRMPATKLGQPINFSFDRSQINGDARYQLEVRILIDDHPWFRNTTAIMLPSNGDLGTVTLDPYQYPEMERPWMRLQGTVGYREKMMVPEGSILRFKLVRASREAGSPVIRQKTIPFTGVGMLFDLTFSNSEMRNGPHYIEITLENNRDVLFKSEPISVLKYGWETPPEITLKRNVNR